MTKYSHVPWCLWMGLSQASGIEVHPVQLEDHKIDFDDLDILWHDPLYDHYRVRFKGVEEYTT